MDKKKKDSFHTEINSIGKRLYDLSKLHPGKVEYLLFAAIYNEEGMYDSGVERHCILRPSNIDYYNKIANEIKHDIIENKRFLEVFHLKEFKVVCLDDSMSSEISELLFMNGGDWLQKDKEYIVIKKQKALSGIGYSFSLRTNEGYELTPPKPFEGFHSTRFQVFNYAECN